MTKKSIKFEDIKKKVLRDLSIKSDIPGALGSFWIESRPFEVLAHLAINKQGYLYEERPALVEFARTFTVTGDGRSDYMAAYAKAQAEQNFSAGSAAKELTLIALRAREEAIKIVNNWDVRRVGALVDLFPETVPKYLRNASMICFVADNEDGDWMVEFDSDKPRTRQPEMNQTQVNDLASRHGFISNRVEFGSDQCYRVILERDDNDDRYYQAALRTTHDGKVACHVGLYDGSGNIVNDGEVIEESLAAAIANAAHRIDRIAERNQVIAQFQEEQPHEEPMTAPRPRG